MKYIFQLLLSVIVISCGQQKMPNDSYDIIKISDIHPNLNLSELGKIDSMVKINSNSFTHFGGIEKTFLLEDKILAHTTTPTTLSLIGRDGHVVAQLAPDYLVREISSVSLHNNLIYVLDRQSMAIHIFNYGLQHLRKLPIPFFAQSLQVTGDSLMSWPFMSAMKLQKIPED